MISVGIDTGSVDGRGGLVAFIGDYGPHAIQAVVAFATVLLAFGYVNVTRAVALPGTLIQGLRFGLIPLSVHLVGFIAFALLSSSVFGGPDRGSQDLLAVSWILTGLVAAVAAVLFFLPWPMLVRLVHGVGSAWWYAIAAAALTPILVTANAWLWKPATALTFRLTRVFLTPFVPSVVADPLSRTVGTQRFGVEIAPGCSGIEGMALMLLFTGLWLAFFHGQYRFPRAFLLIPAGIGLVFVLNSVRIAALILIGNAGAEDVAFGGFHSQAGWIGFNAVAVGVAYAGRRIPWISVARPLQKATPPRYEAAPYLVPFLAILAVSMISAAGSGGGFDRFYPVRLFVAVGALLLYRKTYSNLNWRFGWASPVIGCAVFAVWIALNPPSNNASQNGIGAALATLPTAGRDLWLSCRIAAAVLTVPIAEELAFRGYLLRRLASADFESVSYARWAWVPVIGSSLAFGLMHGHSWIAGTLAGVAYAAAQKWRGRIGDAVIAHATTNALLAAWVMWSRDWSLW